MVYITAPDASFAEKLADLIVSKRVAACVNILGKIRSIYRWKGRIERTGEIALIAKTTVARYSALEKLIRAHHPYECPCIVALPLDRGHGPFLKWIRDQVQAD